MRALFVLGLLVILIVGCDSQRVAEVNHDLESGIWHPDSVHLFKLPVESATSYNLYLNIRNNRAYPFHNIYIQYALQDSLGSQLMQQTDEFLLFDSKTGHPLGEGFGDIYTHQIPILQNYSFDKTGSYVFTIQQYMRPELLSGVLSVGFRLEKATNGS